MAQAGISSSKAHGESSHFDKRQARLGQIRSKRKQKTCAKLPLSNKADVKQRRRVTRHFGKRGAVCLD